MKNWLTKKITRPKIEAFIANHASELKTLDIGSSWSPYEKYFPNRTSSDIEPRDGVDIVADAHDLPISDNEFDVILCTEVLEHLHTPEKAISEMLRVLKPGGKLILTTRFMFPMHDVPHDYFRYTEYGMKHLFREWNIIELVPETKNFETLAVLIHRMAFTMEFKGGKFTRTLIFLFAKFVYNLGFLVKKEYGIRRENGFNIVCNTFASGYFIYAEKK
jgi:SAM-dependent methyltransferase